MIPLILGLSFYLGHCAVDWQLPRVRRRRVGGIVFLRIGRRQFSYCVCRISI